MSQRTRKSLAVGEPTTPQRVTRVKAESISTTPQKVKAEPVSTTPLRTTRRSVAKVEAAAEVNTPTRRTRTSSVSSVLSDVSDIVSESGRVTRRSSRLSGIKPEEIEQPLELLGRKRTSSISSVTSETPSVSKTTTRRPTSRLDTPSQSSSSLDVSTPSVPKTRLLETSIHEDSPFKVSGTRKSKKLSLPTVAENEVDSNGEGKVVLSTKQLEEIQFSSDNDEDSVQVSGKKKTVDRKRKSILPAKNDQLNTIDEDECEIVGKTNSSPRKSLRNSIKENSPSVLVNRIDSANASPKLGIDKFDNVKKTPVQEKSKSAGPQGSPKLSTTPKSSVKVTSEIPAAQATPNSSANVTSKSPAPQVKSKSPVPPSKSPAAQVKSKSPVPLVTSKSPAAKIVSKSSSTPAENKRKSKGNEELLPAEKSAGNIESNKGRTPTKNKEDNDDNSKSNIIPTGNLKRKSKEPVNNNITPRKSLQKVNGSNHSTNDEDKEKPITVEEITLDDDEEDIDMEEESTPQSNQQKVNITETNVKKRKSKGHLELADEVAPASAKKQKSQDHVKEVKEAVDSEQKDDENKENNLKSSKEDSPDQESKEEMIKRIKLETAKALLDEKREKTHFRKKHSEREKMRIRERRLKNKLSKKNLGTPNKTGTPNKKLIASKTPNPDVKKTEVTVKQTSVNTEKPKPNTDVDEQKRLEKILERRALKKQKWLKRLADKKAADETKKREENRLAKIERKKIHEEAVIAKKELMAKMTKQRRPKKKKSALGAAPIEQVASSNVSSSKGPNITLSDIIAKIDAMTQAKKSESDEAKKILTEHNDIEDKSDDIARGQAKSGRWWKDTKDKFSTMVKTPGLRRPHSEKEKLRAEIKHNKEMTRNILDTAARAKEEHRQRRLENIKRREENAKKAEIVQVIKNPAKLKRMKKKQLRLIEKRDTLPIIEKRKAAALKPAEA